MMAYRVIDVDPQIHSCLTTELDGGGWSTSRTAPLYPLERNLVPVKWEVEWTQSWSARFGAEINVLPLPGFEPRIVHPVAFSFYWLCRIDHKLTCPKQTADIIKSKPTYRHTDKDLNVLSYFEIMKVPANCNWYSLLQTLRCSLN